MLRMITHAAATAAVLATAGAAAAQPRAEVAPVMDAMGLPALMRVMRDEGLKYGENLGQDFLQGRGGALWSSAVDAIYDRDRMQKMVGDSLATGLDEAAIPAILDFFRSDLGKKVVADELAARKALLDDEVEAQAHDAWLALESEGGPRWQLLSDFAEVNDLVESNVAGAMTASYAFYQGLSDAGAFGGDLSQDQILTDVWNREDEIRNDTIDWVYSFTSLAYHPLTDDELRAYVEFSRSEAGQAMNAALFTAFNDLFTEISRDLGKGAAKVLAGQDI